MTSHPKDMKKRIDALAHRLEHVLPGQASIKDFVHHNTLHGFQHLPFPEALAEAERLLGITGYPPPESYRRELEKGRIEQGDLEKVLSEDAALAAEEELGPGPSGTILRRDVYMAALLHDFGPVTGCQMVWQVEAMDGLRSFQDDVPRAARESLLNAEGRGEAEALADLWLTCLEKLGLEQFLLHPEDLTDLSPGQAERLFTRLAPGGPDDASQFRTHSLVRHEADRLLGEIIDRVGRDLTLRGLLLALSGHDILDDFRPSLLRHLASFLDLGLAGWHSPDRDKGFYAAWRESALTDPAYLMDDMPDWRDEIRALPDEAVQVVAAELTLLGLDGGCWEGYLERLALELPGWSGMVLWRHLRPGYGGEAANRVEIADYLAVRLVLERMFARLLCRRLWRIEPRLDILRWHFRHHRAELLVRWSLFNSRLPEYLATRIQDLLLRTDENPAREEEWWAMAHMVWTWRLSPSADQPDGNSLHRGAWPLFRLCQHLGLGAGQLADWSREAVDSLLECLVRLENSPPGYVWLRAYERNYRDQVLGALTANRGRGRWAERDQRPAAQVVFCMDDREEGIRRHLEEAMPEVETLGAAGFFGLPINWRGLDDEGVSALCPVVVRPAHEIREVPKPGAEADHAAHVRRRARRIGFKQWLVDGGRRGLLSPTILSMAGAPVALVLLTGRLFAPRFVGRLEEKLRRAFDGPVATQVAVVAEDDGRPATPDDPRLGLTDTEQAERVAAFLRNIGLAQGFAPLVVMMGHGSSSRNNPHLAAYDCGACSGRHGGPNARAFAVIANRPEIRARLAENGINIPDDTWFIGAEHDTGCEDIVWYDGDSLPDGLAPAFADFRRAMAAAVMGSAHERCRRLASAPRRPSGVKALAHIAGRSFDISQARPELGHATNASAFIGRRSATRGAFFDRRMFLVSYDPTQDETGRIIENILLAVGPVGAGINLEYYFSTVNNEKFGCGTKITHNVTGLLGVMEGTSSDLRTGLPRQMIEIHEAMRLLVIVEQKTEVLTRIYNEQPAIRELVGNAWLQLAAMDPVGGDIHVFDPAAGWRRWEAPASTVPVRSRSIDCYDGHSGPIAPALLEETSDAVG